MIRALIVDDEPVARAGLWALLDADGEIEIVGECATGREAVEAIRAERPDLVFLDVQMPDLDGFGALAELDPEETPVIVFVTAHDEHALKAFEASAVDYLVKPFDRERFERALARAKRFLARDRLSAVKESLGALSRWLGAGPEGRAAVPGERIVVTAGDRVAVLPQEEIDWIEADRNHIVVHARGEAYRTRDTFGGFLERLDPGRFLQVSRSAAVNADRVRELRATAADRLDVVLEGGAVVASSRRYRGHVREFFGEPPSRR
ncbi:MAG: response regulator [Gemmatimonadetes bacterium]|nr:response regulator [Gemmatimonadota bacterium]